MRRARTARRTPGRPPAADRPAPRRLATGPPGPRPRRLAQQQARSSAPAASGGSGGSAGGSGGGGGTDGGDDPPPAGTLGQQAVAIAQRYLGVPYVWGGASPSGLRLLRPDVYVYGQLGVSLAPLHRRAVERRAPRRRRASSRPATWSSSTRPRPRRHLHRRRPVHPRPAHRRRGQDLGLSGLVRGELRGRRPDHRVGSRKGPWRLGSPWYVPRHERVRTPRTADRGRAAGARGDRSGARNGLSPVARQGPSSVGRQPTCGRSRRQVRQDGNNTSRGER